MQTVKIKLATFNKYTFCGRPLNAVSALTARLPSFYRTLTVSSEPISNEDLIRWLLYCGRMVGYLHQL